LDQNHELQYKINFIVHFSIYLNLINIIIREFHCIYSQVIIIIFNFNYFLFLLLIKIFNYQCYNEHLIYTLNQLIIFGEIVFRLNNT
jgi:hypothetical protein